MATPTVARAKTASGQKETPANVADTVKVPGISRREFLYYAWGASLALLTAETTGLLVWFGLPRFRAGEFGGVFTLDASALPQAGSAPVDNPQGKFWLSHTATGGVVAIYKVCTHLGCLYKWVDANGRFECPCHGSKYQLDGTYIEGPAPRSLDRFSMTIRTKSGQQLITDAEGNPIPVANAADIAEMDINTGARIKRAGRV
jgi:cytochrome b6-f complex iron-sulfur subunit